MASNRDTMIVVVLTEKPSVARDIAHVLGADTRRDGALWGGGFVVTWAVGHLVTLAQPHEIDPAWKIWRADLLPMLPSSWPLSVLEKTKEQFEIVRRILTMKEVGSIVCATDAGREGELIFRYIYEAAGASKPFQRLWLSSMTTEAIRRGFAELKAGDKFDNLADAARGRSRADWLVGLNLSRAYTVLQGSILTVGRVQTPTLAMIVERELAIRSFIPEQYLEIEAAFAPDMEGRRDERFTGVWFDPAREVSKPEADDEPWESKSRARRLPADGVAAARIVERVKTGRAAVKSVEAKTRRSPPALFYDLTELQRHASRLFGFSAEKTLNMAQSLYERRKLLSYPRTDSRYLSTDVARTLSGVVDAIKHAYEPGLPKEIGRKELGSRFVRDAKVTDHHAIIPTDRRAGNETLSGDERRIYDLVCRRLLMAWMDDNVACVTTIVTAVSSDPSGNDNTKVVDLF